MTEIISFFCSHPYFVPQVGRGMCVSLFEMVVHLWTRLTIITGELYTQENTRNREKPIINIFLLKWDFQHQTSPFFPSTFHVLLI